jgi:hypothetical protein
MLHSTTLRSGLWEALQSGSSTSVPVTRFIQTGRDILYPETQTGRNNSLHHDIFYPETLIIPHNVWFIPSLIYLTMP